MGDAQAMFESIPPVTRYLLCGCVGITLAGNFGIFSPYSLTLSLHGLANFEVWRLFTAFLFQGKLGFPFLINMLYLYKQSTSLETQVFSQRSSDYLYMILFGGFLLIPIGLYWPFPILGQGLLLMITYYWSCKFPDARMNFFGIPFPGRYLPWFLVGMNFLMGGFPIVQIFGILVGHIYFYLETVVPLVWHRRLLKTPWFLFRLFPPEQNAMSPDYPRDVGRAVGPQNLWGGQGRRM